MITFLILKYDIENSRIELRGIVVPVQVGGLLGGGGGGGGQRVYCPPPLKLLGGLALPAPPPPSSYAYAVLQLIQLSQFNIVALI